MNSQQWLFAKLPILPEHIQRVEAFLGRDLPKELLCLLEFANAASPKNNIFPSPDGNKLVCESIIDFRIDSGPESIEEIVEAFIGILPKKAIPFALDPFGNIFYLYFHEYSEKVFFLRHDDDSDKKKLLLADSLKTFFDKIQDKHNA